MKFNPDNLNIHELAVEEPEKDPELVFDPTRDLNPDFWPEFDKRIDNSFEKLDSDFVLAARVASTAKLLGRKLNHPEKVWQKIGKKIVSINDPHLLTELFIAGHPYPPPQKFIDGLLAAAKDNSSVVDQLSAAADLELFGQKLDKDYKNKLIQQRSWDRLSRTEPDFFLSQINLFKILGLDFKIPDEKWEEFRKLAGRSVVDNSSIDTQLLIAKYLTILAADEVRIPEGGGLELIHHKKSDLQQEAPQLPYQKQF